MKETPQIFELQLGAQKFVKGKHNNVGPSFNESVCKPASLQKWCIAAQLQFKEIKRLKRDLKIQVIQLPQLPFSESPRAEWCRDSVLNTNSK